MKASSTFKHYLLIHLLYFTFLTLFSYDFSNTIFRPANVMSCYELNEQNGVEYDKVYDFKEESEELDYVIEEFWKFENHHNQNLEETKKVS